MSPADSISSSCHVRTGAAPSCERLSARKPGTASRRAVIDASRSGSGAKSRAKIAKRLSPTTSIAFARRSHTRCVSRSKSSRRTIATWRSRSKRTDGDSPASSRPSIAARWSRSAAISPTTASREPDGSRSSPEWIPRYVPSCGLSVTSRTKRSSTRSQKRSSRGPASAAGAGRVRTVSGTGASVVGRRWVGSGSGSRTWPLAAGLRRGPQRSSASRRAPRGPPRSWHPRPPRRSRSG